MKEAGEKYSGRASEPGSQPSSGTHPDTEVEVECFLHARPHLWSTLGVSKQLTEAQQGAPTADLAAGPALHSLGFPDTVIWALPQAVFPPLKTLLVF